MHTNITATSHVEPSFHGRLLATWHRFGRGRLFYPVLMGWYGSQELVYLVLQHGDLVGFSTWQEARDVAAAARWVKGTPLVTLEQGQSSLHARRPTRKARRSTPRAQRLRFTMTASGDVYELAGTAFQAVGPDGWPLDM